MSVALKNKVLAQVDGEVGSVYSKATGPKQSLGGFVSEKEERSPGQVPNWDELRKESAGANRSPKQWLVVVLIVVGSLALFYLAIRKGWLKI